MSVVPRKNELTILTIFTFLTFEKVKVVTFSLLRDSHNVMVVKKSLFSNFEKGWSFQSLVVHKAAQIKLMLVL